MLCALALLAENLKVMDLELAFVQNLASPAVSALQLYE